MQVYNSVIENCCLAGIGIGIFDSKFFTDLTAYKIQQTNLRVKNSEIYTRFGIQKFFKSQNEENEQNYLSNFKIFFL